MLLGVYSEYLVLTGNERIGKVSAFFFGIPRILANALCKVVYLYCCECLLQNKHMESIYYKIY